MDIRAAEISANTWNARVANRLDFSSPWSDGQCSRLATQNVLQEHGPPAFLYNRHLPTMVWPPPISYRRNWRKELLKSIGYQGDAPGQGAGRTSRVTATEDRE